MKGITLVQAFQYWAKVFAISLPLFVLMSVSGGYNKHLHDASSKPAGYPRLDSEDKATVNGEAKAPANTISMSSVEATAINFDQDQSFIIGKISPVAKTEGADPIPLSALVYPLINDTAGAQVAAAIAANKPFDIPKGVTLICPPVKVTHKGIPMVKDGKPVVTAAKIEFKKGGKVTFTPTYAKGGLNPTGHTDPGAVTPNAPSNGKWTNPYGPMTSKWGFPVLYTYSLIIALVCGTAGLPHILVRFYTNPDGRSAKKTTFWVMVLLGLFYVFTPIWGVLGRALMPALYVNSGFDTAVIKLPTLLDNELMGNILSGITSAGAFAAFMSTFSGLLVSMSGALAHDIYGRMLRPNASPKARLVAFKVSAIAIGCISMGLGLIVEPFDIATLVLWAFAIGAASYFPLLLLGSWWRGLTKQGAAAGMLLGGLLSFAAIVTHMALEKKYLTWELPPLVRALMEQPAIWGVPLSIVTMIVVSKMTAKNIPPDVTMKMLRLHAPEEMGLSKNYVEG